MNLNFVFSTSKNLNILIEQLTNFEFFNSNLTKQLVLSSQQKVYDGNYDAARRFDVDFWPQPS